MNAEDFRAATESMEDVALWDVRRVALLAARRDDATPVRYFEEAVSESLRALHRLSQESLWDELQKHELGKRTLRALAAEYKPARMVAFEPDDLRRASVRFWEALRSEDELLREALAAYDYGAASGLLARLSGVLDREVVQRLVYINCPRQNVVEEVVGTITRCTTNELKMLASRLYDRLDKTGTLTPENREFAKKLPYCKTKEELRVAVRDLLRMFKRKPPPDEANPSHIIGPSVATVTVSYKGQNRHVAAVVRIERMDDIAPEQPQMEAPPPLWPEPTVAPMARAGSGSDGSIVTVNSDRTIPPSKRDSEQMLAMIGGSPYSVAAPSKAPSAKPTPPGSALGGGGGAAALTGSGLASPHPAASARPSPHVSVVGVAGPGSDVLSGKAAPSPKSATPPGSVLGGGAGSAKSGGGGAAAATASELGSVRGSNVMPRASSPPPPSVLSAAAAAAAPPAPVSDVGSTRAPSALRAPKATPPGSVLGSDATGLTRKTTPAGSVVGAVVDTAAAAVVAGLASDAGSTRSAGLTQKTTPAGSMLGGGGGAAAGPGSDVGSTRTGLTHKTTPAGSVVNVNGTAAAAVAASGPGSFRSSKTTPAGSVLGGPAAAAAAGPGSDLGSTRSGPVTQKTTPAGSVRGSGYGGGGAAAAPAAASVPGSVVGGAAGDRSSGAGSVKSMTSRNSTSSQSSMPALNGRTAAGSGAASSQHGYGSISFDHPNLPVPTPKTLYTEVEEDQPGNDGGSERSSSPSSGSSSRSSRGSGPATGYKSPLLQSRQPSRTPSSVVADRKSLVPSRAASSSVAADREF